MSKPPADHSFRLTFANSPLPMWVYDVATLRFLAVNFAAETKYGYTSEQFMAMRVSDIRPPEDVARLEAYIAQPRGEARVAGVWRHRLSNGRVIPVEIHSQSIRFEGRDAVVVTAIDLSEREQTDRERELLLDRERTARLQADHANERLKFLAEAARVLASSLEYETTLATVASLATPAIADWCAVDLWEDGSLRRVAVANVDPEKVKLAYRLAERYPPNRDATGGAWNVVRTRKPELYTEIDDAQIESAARDDEHRELIRQLGLRSAIVVPLIARDRVLGTITLVSADPARKYQAEDLALAQEVADRAATAIDNAVLLKEVTALNVELEERVLTRTAELREANERLEAATGEAQLANQAKSEFLSRMSHELRTPLNVVLGFAQLMETDEEEPLCPDHRESVGHIIKAARHLTELINDALDISRIESGRMALSIEPVQVDELVRDVIGLMRPLADERSVRLEAEAAGCAAFVLADRQRFRQVVLNLVSNGIKYNHRGGSLRISCAAGTSGRLRVRFDDTGPGLSVENLKRLFTPFERLGATQVEGVGLGLTLCKYLVEAMQGELGVESTVGKGSRFWLELPCAEADSRAPADDGKLADTSQQPADHRGTRTILYFEDNLTSYTLVERILARRGDINLLPAIQGQLGLDLARKHQPDLIILDLHLPDIPGHEVLLRLKADPVTRAIPVIIASADATLGQRQRLLEAGAEEFLAKPLDVPEFTAIVERLLRASDESP